jgi:hypothetical protein
MPFDVKKFVADYINRKYNRPCITVMDGCCRKCLKGTASGYCVKKRPIEGLMNEGIIDPYQIASAFHNGSVHYAPYFKEMVINMNSEEKPCKYPGTCELKCVLCHSLIVNRDDIELDIWPGFKVHKACTSPCLYPGCMKRLPTLPAYLSLQRSTLMCDLHKDTNTFQKLSMSVSSTLHEYKESITKNPQIFISVKQPRPPQLSSVSRIAQSEQPAKKTFTFKKPPGKAKADKFDERGKSKSILGFFKTPGAEAAAKKRITVQEQSQQTNKSSNEENAPRRFIKKKETGEIFGYWKGNSAYHIETDEILFTRTDTFNETSRPVKFDFVPPISINESKLDSKLSFNSMNVEVVAPMHPTVSSCVESKEPERSEISHVQRNIDEGTNSIHEQLQNMSMECMSVSSDEEKLDEGGPSP